jgi:hypothetical protein
MQLTAKLFQILPVESGMGKNGEWKKQSIVVELDGQFPRKVCFTIWGDKIGSTRLELGQMLTVDFDIESREYNGRWYTDAKAWKIELANTLPPDAPLPTPPPAYSFSELPPPPAGSGDVSDLPF